MSISGIGASSWPAQGAASSKAQQNMPGSNFSVDGSQSASTPGSASSAIAKPANAQETPEQTFLDYMKETPAQRMQYAWLAQHGVSKAAFDAMSGADKQKLLDQMKQDLQDQMKQAAEKNTHKATLDILA